MPEERRCVECGAVIPPNARQGFCAPCLLNLGIQAGQPDPLESETSEFGEALLPGAKVRYFGDYELLEEIARGGMGVVWRARQVSLGRIVALKMILKGELASEAEVERFHREAQAAANLDHPNIVAIYEVGEHQGQHYFSMRLVEGASLSAWLREDGGSKIEDGRQGLSPSSTLHSPSSSAKVMAKVARAVHHAHQRGILHRDIKPGNILIDAQGEPHVTDFGLAKRVDMPSDLTRSESVMGTPSYMSPEQARGLNKDLTTATDIWSMGAVLYHLLTGRPPFQAATAWETLKAVVEQEPAKPREMNRRVDRDLETMCLKCLEKDAQRRYASADALADDLDRWLKQEPILARPVPPWERGMKWCKRNPRAAGLVAAVVLVAAFGFTAWRVASGKVDEVIGDSGGYWALQAFADTNNLRGPLLLRRLEEALKRQPTNFVCWEAKATVLARTNRLPEALVAFSEAIDLARRRAAPIPQTLFRAYWHRADVLRRSSRLAEDAADSQAAALVYRRVKGLPPPTPPPGSMETEHLADYCLAPLVSIEFGAVNREYGLQQFVGVDSVTQPAQIGGRECLSCAYGPLGQGYVYLRIDPAFKLSCGGNVRVEVEYFNKPGGEFGIGYDARCCEYARSSETVALGPREGWAVAQFDLTDVRFENRQHGGADFRLWTGTPLLYVRRVTVFREYHSLAENEVNAGRSATSLWGPPASADPYFWDFVGKQLAKSNLLAEADRALTKAADLASGDTNGFHEALRRALQNRTEVRRRLVEATPGTPEFVAAKARVAEQAGNTNGALACLEEGTRQHAQSPLLWNAKGEVLRRCAKTNEALAAFTKAIEAASADMNAFSSVRNQALLNRRHLYKADGRLVEAGVDNCMARGIQVRDKGTRPELIDLSPFYNIAVPDLFSLPPGRMKLGQIDFDARGAIQLPGLGLLKPAVDLYPFAAVRGITLDRNVQRIHFLLSTGWAEPDGTKVAVFVVHYADNQQEELPIIYGEDVRDWWLKNDPKGVSRSVVAWTGTTPPASSNAGEVVRLFLLTRANPRPEAKVRSIDFVSTMTKCAPMLVAITVE